MIGIVGDSGISVVNPKLARKLLIPMKIAGISLRKSVIGLKNGEQPGPDGGAERNAAVVTGLLDDHAQRGSIRSAMGLPMNGMRCSGRTSGRVLGVMV